MTVRWDSRIPHAGEWTPRYAIGIAAMAGTFVGGMHAVEWVVDAGASTWWLALPTCAFAMAMGHGVWLLGRRPR